MSLISLARLITLLLMSLGVTVASMGWSGFTVAAGATIGMLAWVVWEQRFKVQALHQKLSEKNGYLEQIESEIVELKAVREQLERSQQEKVAWRDRQQGFEQTLIEKNEYIELLEQDMAKLQQVNEQLQHSQRAIDQYHNHLQALQQQISDKDIYIELLENDNSGLLQLQAQLQQVQEEANHYRHQVEGLLVEKTSYETQLSQINRKRELRRSEPSDVVELDLSNPSEFLEPYSLIFDCIEDLSELQPKIFLQVINKILALQTDPRPRGYELIQKYRQRYRNVYRIRSGNYRICYAVDDEPVRQVRVLMVDNRDERIYDERLGRRLCG